MIRKQSMASVLVRLPPEAKAFIEAESAKNCSSQNSEIVRAIIARMESLPEAGKKPVPAS